MAIVLQIFRNGDADAPSEYKGPRDAAGIVTYLKKKSEPASALLSSAAEVILMSVVVAEAVCLVMHVHLKIHVSGGNNCPKAVSRPLHTSPPW